MKKRSRRRADGVVAAPGWAAPIPKLDSMDEVREMRLTQRWVRYAVAVSWGLALGSLGIASYVVVPLVTGGGGEVVEAGVLDAGVAGRVLAAALLALGALSFLATGVSGRGLVAGVEAFIEALPRDAVDTVLNLETLMERLQRFWSAVGISVLISAALILLGRFFG